MAEEPDENESEAEDLEELRVEIREPDSFEIEPASSYRGGVQMQGDFLIEFLLDTYETPGANVFSVEDRIPQELIRFEDFEGGVVQRKQVGVMMSQQNAFGLATWIIADLIGEPVTQDHVEQAILQAFEDQLRD